MPTDRLLPLSAPPRLLAMSAGSPHGRNGDERYRSSFWVLNLILDGRGSLACAGTQSGFRHGSVLVVPPDLAVHYRFAGPTTKVWAHFQVAAGAQAVPMPLCTELDGRLPAFRASLVDAAIRFPDEPERSTARVWDLLWGLAAGPVVGRPARSPLAEQLLRHLEEHLVRPVVPAALARSFGVSTTHLNRLCRGATGLPMVAFVRRRRLERAVHLLRGSALPIAHIAAQVGYPDLSHFNKLMRAYAGRAPSAVRDGRPP